MTILFGLDLFFIGVTLGFIGKVILVVTVLNVHSHIVHEHKIDMDVLSAMKRERRLAIYGLAFMTVGYLFEIASFGYFSGF